MMVGEDADLKPVWNKLDSIGWELPLGEGLGSVEPLPDGVDGPSDAKRAFESMMLKVSGALAKCGCLRWEA